MDFTYKPDGKVLRGFMRSDAFVRGLRGPVGSGKSVACCVELFRRALQQAPDKNGWRKTRWAVTRNTNPELKTTTIKTWLDWFPEDRYGRFRWSPPFTHHIIIPEMGLDMETIFVPLDSDEDVKKLLSLELTGGWINEARETPKAIVDALTMRVNRFPSQRDGGATWAGVIMDTNPPAEDHWWPIMAGDAPLPDYIAPEQAAMLVKPANWEFFNQPPAMRELMAPDGKSILGYEPSPSAENRHNMSEAYYPNLIQGKTKAWIDVYVMNRLGTASDGKPVYSGFRQETHVLERNMDPVPGRPIYVGIDFGLTPASPIMQPLGDGRVLILDEIVTYDMGIKRYGELLARHMKANYQGFDVKFYCDPAGDFRSPNDELTSIQILAQAGIKALPTHTNDPVLRIEAVESVLSRLVDGRPAMMVNPRCKVLIQGFTGGYHYRRIRVSGSERYDDRPEKNRFSHVHDALQYAFLGAGEGKALISGSHVHQQRKIGARHDPFDRLFSGQSSSRRRPWSGRRGLG